MTTNWSPEDCDQYARNQARFIAELEASGYIGPAITTEKEATTMQTTTTPIKFDCIPNLIYRYERATHGYYFSNDTTRFFSGKYYGPVYRVGDTEVFVDSVRDTWSGQPRQYRVKVWNGSDSSIDTVTEYKTLRSAEKSARRHAEALANQ